MQVKLIVSKFHDYLLIKLKTYYEFWTGDLIIITGHTLQSIHKCTLGGYALLGTTVIANFFPRSDELLCPPHPSHFCLTLILARCFHNSVSFLIFYVFIRLCCLNGRRFRRHICILDVVPPETPKGLGNELNNLQNNDEISRQN